MLARRVAPCAAMLVALCAVDAPTVRAAELKVMSTVALSATLDEVKPKFERATGHTMTIVYGVIAELKQRVQEGKIADVMLLSRLALDDLQSQGKVAAGSIVNVARSSVSVAARAGAPKPDISTGDALKRTVLASNADRLCRPGEGRCERRSLRQGSGEMRARTILVPGAQAAEVVSKGEAELGVAMASEIVPITGPEGAGVLDSGSRHRALCSLPHP